MAKFDGARTYGDMHSIRAFFMSALVLSVTMAALAQEKIAPKTQALMDALEKALPELETNADRLDKDLKAFADAKDANVALAVDTARLQLMALIA